MRAPPITTPIAAGGVRSGAIWGGAIGGWPVATGAAIGRHNGSLRMISVRNEEWHPRDKTCVSRVGRGAVRFDGMGWGGAGVGWDEMGRGREGRGEMEHLRVAFE